jgi:hypothetical protein
MVPSRETRHRGNKAKSKENEKYTISIICMVSLLLRTSR